MRKGLIIALVLTLALGLAGYTLAQQGPPRGPQGMGPGQMGPGMWGHMGPGMWEHMGPGMMGMGMLGPLMGSPEIMGTMMSIHGEIHSLMGQMMQKYGGAIGQMTPELQQQVRKEMMERMGDILTKHGAALKHMAKAAGK